MYTAQTAPAVIGRITQAYVPKKSDNARKQSHKPSECTVIRFDPTHPCAPRVETFPGAEKLIAQNHARLDALMQS